MRRSLSVGAAAAMALGMGAALLPPPMPSSHRRWTHKKRFITPDEAARKRKRKLQRKARKITRAHQ